MKRISFVLLGGLIFVTAAAAQIGNFNQRGKATQELSAEGLSIAHPSLPINSKVRVANTVSGKEVEATVVGRVPASANRIADLSAGVWQELALSPDTEIRIYTAPAARARPAATPTPPVEQPAVVAAAEPPPEPPPKESAPEPAPAPAAAASQEPSSKPVAAADDGGEEKLPYNITVNTYVNTDEKGGGSIQTPFGYSADADFLAWLTAMIMDSRDSRDFRDARESRETREARESRDSRDIREARERELRDSREARERELRDTHEARERELRNAREARERELREVRDEREARDRDARDERLAREREAREREARDREARDREAREAAIARTPPPPLQPPAPPPVVYQPAPVQDTPVPATRPAPVYQEPPAPVYVPAEPAPSYPIQRPRPVPFEEMQIIPGMPDPNNGKIYRLQIASFSMPEAAELTVKIAEDVGFSAVKETYESVHRVLVINIPSSMVHSAMLKLGALGIRQVWVRE